MAWILTSLQSICVVKTSGASRRPLAHVLYSLPTVNQSGFRSGHSTKNCRSAGAGRHSFATYRGDMVALIRFLLAAFNTVDHELLYNVIKLPWQWRCSPMVKWYQLGRSQYMRIESSCSFVINLVCGVLPGSVQFYLFYRPTPPT